MKISIIGAGNMGGAIARGLMKHGADDRLISVSNLEEEPLKKLQEEFPRLETTTDNLVAIKDADVVIFAVKPWVLPSVAAELRTAGLPKVVVSIAAGVDLKQLEGLFGNEHALFYVIPNTAISVSRGMTFITAAHATEKQTAMVRDIFGSMGQTAVLAEKYIPAATALSSCGIAYAYKYIQACVQAGVQLGFTPADAQRYAVATVMGAMEMLCNPGATPQTEIDRVTTPGGMTIKGINMLEHTGFASSVIMSILEPLKK